MISKVAFLLSLCVRACVCVWAHASVCPSAPFLFPLRQNHLSWLLNMDENSKRMRSRHPKGLYHLPTPKDMSLDGEQNWSPQNAPLRLKYSFKLIIFKKQQTPETLRTPWRVPFLREIRVSTRALRLQGCRALWRQRRTARPLETGQRGGDGNHTQPCTATAPSVWRFCRTALPPAPPLSSLARDGL